MSLGVVSPVVRGRYSLRPDQARSFPTMTCRIAFVGSRSTGFPVDLIGVGVAEQVTGTGAEGGRDVVATPARAANSSMVRVWSSLSEFAIVPAYSRMSEVPPKRPDRCSCATPTRRDGHGARACASQPWTIDLVQSAVAIPEPMFRTHPDWIRSPVERHEIRRSCWSWWSGSNPQVWSCTRRPTGVADWRRGLAARELRR